MDFGCKKPVSNLSLGPFSPAAHRISRAAAVLPKPANVSLKELFDHKLGGQGGMGGTRIKHLTGKAPAQFVATSAQDPTAKDCKCQSTLYMAADTSAIQLKSTNCRPMIVRLPGSIITGDRKNWRKPAYLRSEKTCEPIFKRLKIGLTGATFFHKNSGALARLLYPLNSARCGRSLESHPHPAVYAGICTLRIFPQSPDDDPGPAR